MTRRAAALAQCDDPGATMMGVGKALKPSFKAMISFI